MVTLCPCLARIKTPSPDGSRRGVAAGGALLLYDVVMGTAAPPPSGSARSELDFSRAFTFVFEDPDWVGKMLVGALFTALGLFAIGFVWVGGYVARLLRRTARDERPLLPEWDDLGGLFREGIGVVAVLVAHAAPLAIVGGLSALALTGAVSVLREGGTAPQPAAILVLVVVFAGYLVFAIATLAFCFYFPAALLRHVIEGRIGAAFEARENLRFIRRTLNDYAAAVLAFLAASFLAQFGILFFCVGIFPAAFWSCCVLGYALGETARRSGEQLRSQA